MAIINFYVIKSKIVSPSQLKHPIVQLTNFNLVQYRFWVLVFFSPTYRICGSHKLLKIFCQLILFVVGGLCCLMTQSRASPSGLFASICFSKRLFFSPHVMCCALYWRFFLMWKCKYQRWLFNTYFMLPYTH